MTGRAPSPRGDDPGGSEGGRHLAERLLAGLRQEATHADTKASVLVGAQAMAAAVGVGVLAGGGWGPASLSVPARILWWAGTVCFVASLVALLLAVFPRYGRGTWRPGMPVTYFTDIHAASLRGGTVLREALENTGRAPMTGLVAALTENSRIVTRKHRWIRAGVAFFTVTVALFPGALLLG